MKKAEILINRPVCLRLSILELSKILMREFWYNFVKPENGEKEQLWYMDIDSFIVYIKIYDIYKNIAEDIETRFDTWNYGLDKQFIKWKNESVIGLMKDELGAKIITKFDRLREKPCSYLIDDSSEDKKAKGTKKCVIKKRLKGATELYFMF